MAKETKYAGRNLSVFSKKENREVTVDLSKPEYVNEEQIRNTAVAPSGWW